MVVDSTVFEMWMRLWCLLLLLCNRGVQQRVRLQCRDAA